MAIDSVRLSGESALLMESRFCVDGAHFDGLDLALLLAALTAFGFAVGRRLSNRHYDRHVGIVYTGGYKNITGSAGIAAASFVAEVIHRLL